MATISRAKKHLQGEHGQLLSLRPMGKMTSHPPPVTASTQKSPLRHQFLLQSQAQVNGGSNSDSLKVPKCLVSQVVTCTNGLKKINFSLGHNFPAMKNLQEEHRQVVSMRIMGKMARLTRPVILLSVTRPVIFFQVSQGP